MHGWGRTSPRLATISWSFPASLLQTRLRAEAMYGAIHVHVPETKTPSSPPPARHLQQATKNKAQLCAA